MFLPRGHHLHLHYLCILTEFSQTHQSARLLRVMGKYPLQRRHLNVRIPNTLGPALPSLPVPRLLDPNVSFTPPSPLFYQRNVPIQILQVRPRRCPLESRHGHQRLSYPLQKIQRSCP